MRDKTMPRKVERSSKSTTTTTSANKRVRFNPTSSAVKKVIKGASNGGRASASPRDVPSEMRSQQDPGQHPHLYPNYLYTKAVVGPPGLSVSPSTSVGHGSHGYSGNAITITPMSALPLQDPGQHPPYPYSNHLNTKVVFGSPGLSVSPLTSAGHGCSGSPVAELKPSSLQKKRKGLKKTSQSLPAAVPPSFMPGIFGGGVPIIDPAYLSLLANPFLMSPQALMSGLFQQNGLPPQLPLHPLLSFGRTGGSGGSNPLPNSISKPELQLNSAPVPQYVNSPFRPHLYTNFDNPLSIPLNQSSDTEVSDIILDLTVQAGDEAARK